MYYNCLGCGRLLAHELCDNSCDEEKHCPMRTGGCRACKNWRRHARVKPDCLPHPCYGCASDIYNARHRAVCKPLCPTCGVVYDTSNTWEVPLALYEAHVCPNAPGDFYFLSGTTLPRYPPGAFNGRLLKWVESE